MTKPTLQDRVAAFRRLELPGQPMSMHMGTAYLVSDLAREVERLEGVNKELLGLLQQALLEIGLALGKETGEPK